jgi:hypothetical protein
MYSMLAARWGRGHVGTKISRGGGGNDNDVGVVDVDVDVEVEVSDRKMFWTLPSMDLRTPRTARSMSAKSSFGVT